MKTLTTLLTLFLVAGALFFNTQQAQATPTMPTIRTTQGVGQGQQARLLSLPTAGRSQRNLGVQHSTLLESASTLGALIIADIVIGSVVGLGNLYAALAGREQFGWGLIGTLFFGGHTLLGMGLLGNDKTFGMGIALILTSGLMTALSFMNLSVGLTKSSRQRRHHRRSRRNRDLGPFGSVGKTSKPLLNATF